MFIRLRAFDAETSILQVGTTPNKNLSRADSLALKGIPVICILLVAWVLQKRTVAEAEIEGIRTGSILTQAGLIEEYQQCDILSLHPLMKV